MPDPARLKAFGGQIPVVVCFGSLASIAGAIAGWFGDGVIGKMANPGIQGLVLGAVLGLVIGVATIWPTIVLFIWCSGSRARFNIMFKIMFIAFAGIALIPEWLTGGWRGALNLAVRAIPLFLIGILLVRFGRSARKHAALDRSQATPHA